MFFSLIQIKTLQIGLNKQFTLFFCTPFLFLIRVSLTTADGTLIFQTNGTEKVYDALQPPTVNPFLAYTPNGTVSSVS
jgi:hypothetical protein